MSQVPKKLMQHQVSGTKCSGGVTGTVMGMTDDEWFITGDFGQLSMERSSAG